MDSLNKGFYTNLIDTFKEEDMEYNIDYSFEMVDENSFILKIKNVNNLDIIFSGIKTKMSVGWNS